MDWKELFTPAAIAASWQEVYSNRIPYLGSTLFPARKKAGLDLSWIKGSKGLPISLMPSAFDAKATFRDRIGVSKVETEMPFFREGFKIKEKDRQELLRVQESNDPYLNAILARVFDDANNLIEGALVVPERMVMQLLFPASGEMGISIKANGVDYTYDYDAQDAWKTTNYTALSSSATWDNASTADPFAALSGVADDIEEATGTRPTLAVMNRATFNLMAKTDAIKSRFLTTIGTTIGYLTEADVKAVIKDVTGFNIVVYDKKYRDEDHDKNTAVHSFVPDDYVSILPGDGPVGNVWYGTTPEEADLRGAGNAQVAIVNTGVAITQIIDPHPVNINTFASEICLPSFERMNEVGLLKVK